MEELIKTTKGKKCDYCDEFAEFKIKVEGIYTYVCKPCSKELGK